jgi:hypothetical protein
VGDASRRDDGTRIIQTIELTGTRIEQRDALDLLIARLEWLRWRLVGTRRPSDQSGYEYASPYIDSPSWPWLAAGIVLAASFVILTLIARSFAS